MINRVSRKESRRWRHKRVRRNVSGTAACPRMAVAVSGRHVYVQFVDDEQGRTVASASSLKVDGANNMARAQKVGEMAGQAALQKGIKRVVVDRGGFKFHGCVKAVVAGAIAAGVMISDKPLKPEAEKKPKAGGGGADKKAGENAGDKGGKKPAKDASAKKTEGGGKPQKAEEPAKSKKES